MGKYDAGDVVLLIAATMLGLVLGATLSAPAKPPTVLNRFNTVVRTNDFMGNTYFLAFPKE